VIAIAPKRTTRFALRTLVDLDLHGGQLLVVWEATSSLSH